MATLPKEWTIKKLGTFAEYSKGKKPIKQKTTSNDLFKHSYIDIKAFEQGIVESYTDGEKCIFCSEKDFLMVWDGSRSGYVGKGMNGALGSTLMRINFPLMNNSYSYYFLQSKYLEINKRAKGTGTPHVDPNLLWDYDFPVIPLHEQNKIVEIIEELFSELDKGVESLKKAKEQLKVYRQAVLKNAFEGKLTEKWREENKYKLEPVEILLEKIKKEREETARKQGKKLKPIKPLTEEEIAELPKLPDGWTYLKLGNLIQEPKYGTSKKCSYEIVGIGVLRIPNIINGTIDSSDLKFASFSEEEKATYKLSDGDILLIRSNGSVNIVGRCALVRPNEEQYLFAGYLIRLSPFFQIVNSKYILLLLTSLSIRLQIESKARSTSGVNNINSDEIKSIIVPYCTLSEQQLIANEIETRFSACDEMEKTIEEGLKKAESLRQSILKKAFEGKLTEKWRHENPKLISGENSAEALLRRIRYQRMDTD